MASSGNFCTLNPLTQPNSGTFSEGNLLFTHTSSAWRTTAGTHGMRTGKWYWESYQYESLSGNGFPIGVYDIDSGLFASAMAGDYPTGSTAKGPAYTAYSNSGSYASRYNAGTETNMTLSIGVSGDVWQCALDLDNGKIWFGKNNSWDNSGNPATGDSPSYSGGQLSDSTTRTWVPITCSYNDSSSENFPQNFGQDSTFSARISAGGNADDNGFGDFKYAPPTGFLALCSGNLPVSDDIDPAQTNDDFPGQQFNAITWTGNRQYNSTVNNITGVGFQPDLVWLKILNNTYDWRLVDSSRGVTKAMRSNQTTAEQTESNGIYQFDSDGFSVKGDNNYNSNGDPYIGYCWRANGGTTATNNDGSITSSVQANDKAGFSIITWTASGSNGSIGHGLSAKPDFHIIKKRNGTSGWAVYHKILGATKYFRLDTNGTVSTSQYYYNNTEPDATKIYLGDNGVTNHPSGDTYVCYAWREVEGYSRFGSYEGNNNTDGPFVYTGFRPRMLCIKGVDEAYSWFVFDSARNTFNLVDKHVRWDGTDAEITEPTGARRVDFLSNGFKVKASGASLNGNNDTYVYMAWGDVPFKYNNTF